MKKALKYILTAAIWLGIWQALATLAVREEILLPSIPATTSALYALVGEGGFWKSVLYSLARITAGFALGTAAGTALAVITSLSEALKIFFSPLMSIIKSTPVASFIILALVWLKSGNVPVFTAFLIVLPVIWANTATGIIQTDADLLEMSRAFGMKRSTVVFKIYIPSVLPYFSAAVKTAVGMAWKAGIAAEVICTASSSIGGGIYDSKVYLDTPSLFAWTIVVVILSIVLEKLIVKLIGQREGRAKNDKA
ncbi:MAG: ABC transporter permease subunit [Clostridiales bacterium]|nr:ABC transporter permease subunit [Clostridiales bacterium]